MKIKRLKIDWDELDEAFNNQNQETVYHLDLVIGQVYLEGEGEDELYPEDDESVDPVSAHAHGVRDASMRVVVERPDTALKIVWLKEFMQEQEEELGAEVLAKIESALALKDPAPAIKEALNQHPEARDRWYLYRSDRIHDLIDTWLEKHDVTPINPAPWHVAD